MGYTHYFYTAKTINKVNWEILTGAVEILLKDCNRDIQKEYDDTDEPEISEQRIRFNGIDDDGHETFMLSREYDGFQDNCGKNKRDICQCFSFCKTARKPYDKYVTAVLILAKLYLGKGIKLFSDGNANEWQNGIDLINDKMGWKLKMVSRDNDISNAEFKNKA